MLLKPVPNRFSHPTFPCRENMSTTTTTDHFKSTKNLYALKPIPNRFSHPTFQSDQSIEPILEIITTAALHYPKNILLKINILKNHPSAFILQWLFSTNQIFQKSFKPVLVHTHLPTHPQNFLKR